MNIILMGCPGAGKGTQSLRLQKQFGLMHISTGDVLRAEIASGSVLGQQVARVIDGGDLVPDGLMISMLEKIVQPARRGIIFDGFPRTVTQAQALDEMMQRLKRRIDRVAMIDLPESEVIRRLAGRRQCKACAGIFGQQEAAPLGQCPVCGGALYTRPDDAPKQVKHRLEVYRKSTLPVKAYYQNSGKYVEVNGAQPPEQVFEDLVRALKKVE